MMSLPSSFAFFLEFSCSLCGFRFAGNRGLLECPWSWMPSPPHTVWSAPDDVPCPSPTVWRCPNDIPPPFALEYGTTLVMPPSALNYEEPLLMAPCNMKRPCWYSPAPWIIKHLCWWRPYPLPYGAPLSTAPAPWIILSAPVDGAPTPCLMERPCRRPQPPELYWVPLLMAPQRYYFRFLWTKWSFCYLIECG